jgi:hypothetical protein
MIPTHVCETQKEVYDHLRELSCVLSGQTAQRVVQILQDKCQALVTERMELVNKYQLLERPLVKETKAHERDLKRIQKVWERLNAQLSAFKELEMVLPDEAPGNIQIV